MIRTTLTSAVLASAIGLAAGLTSAAAADMPQPVKDNMARAMKDHLVKCYGVNSVAKNDCAQGAHSCAGQATRARDPGSFVLLPAGACEKIDGGSLKAM